MTTPSLEPCPFCGCAMQLKYDRKSEYFGPDGDHEKACLIGSIDFVDYADRDHAISEWNRRSAFKEQAGAGEQPFAWFVEWQFKASEGVKRPCGGETIIRENPGSAAMKAKVEQVKGLPFTDWVRATPLYAAPPQSPELSKARETVSAWARRLSEFREKHFDCDCQPGQSCGCQELRDLTLEIECSAISDDEFSRMAEEGPPEDLGEHPSPSDASVSACPAAEVVEHWGVDVRINGECVLTIESECLSGISDIDRYADTVRLCADHLHAFIGDGKPTPCFACGGSGHERVLGHGGAETVIPCSVCCDDAPSAVGQSLTGKSEDGHD